jgi:hypothetical protein
LDGIFRALGARGFDVAGALADGRLIAKDASDLLARFMRRGKPVRRLFDQTVREIVAYYTQTSPGGVRIYGEMVEVLAQDGNYAGAEELEKLWNELAREFPFTLLCGYSAAHFAAPDAGGALAAIRNQHSRSSAPVTDSLSHFLLSADRLRAASEPSL